MLAYLYFQLFDFYPQQLLLVVVVMIVLWRIEVHRLRTVKHKDSP